jgi:hypothetical protein
MADESKTFPFSESSVFPWLASAADLWLVWRKTRRRFGRRAENADRHPEPLHAADGNQSEPAEILITDHE